MKEEDFLVRVRVSSVAGVARGFFFTGYVELSA